jgi:ubiquitin C-terminal hydrolase
LDNREKRVSIDQCLTHYALDGALMDNITCKYCKKNSSIFTTRSFITLPKIIIMIMSRGEGEKFECDVDFEEELDLADLYTGLKGIDRENNTKYTLLAGTILYGSGGWGHTVAFAKHFDGKYYIFNDSSTRRTTLDEIKKSKIYLLFYQKIN